MDTPATTDRPPLLVRAPLVPVAAALLAGIAAGWWLPLSPGVWAAAGLAGLAVGAVLVIRGRPLELAAAGLLLAVAAGGAVAVRQAYDRVAKDDLVTYVGRGKSLATVRGRIVSVPAIEGPDAASGRAYYMPPRTRFVLAADSIRTSSGWEPASGLAQVTVEEPATHLAAGQRVELCCWMGRFRGADNPGGFDQSDLARRNGQRVRLEVPVADGATVLDPPARAASLSGWYWRLRTLAVQQCDVAGDADSGSLLRALVLGERDASLRELNDAMVRAGTAHLLSISGLHLGIFLGFVYFLCRLVAVGPRRAAGVVLAVLLLYVLLAEPRAPLLRSAIMAGCLAAAALAGRGYNSLNALSLAAIVLLVIDPLQALSAGFQMSFAIVLGIILLYRPMRGLLFGRWLRRRGLVVFRDEQRVRRWLQFRVANGCIAAITMGATAYLVSAPLAAYHFGLFSPWAMPLSLLLLPLVAAVLVPGYVWLALGPWVPNLAHQFARLAGAAADSLATVVRWIGSLPGLCVELRPMPAAWVVGCYLVILAVWQRRVIPFGRAVAGGLLAVMIAATAWAQWPAPAPRSAELHMLAVGGGQCVLLRTPGGRTVLIDAGTQSNLDVAGRVLRPFFRVWGLPEPREAFVSHANTDHFCAVPAMTGRGRLRTAYLSESFQPEDPRTGDAGRELLTCLHEAGVQIVRLRAGSRVDLDEHTSVEVLWPLADLPADVKVNDTSLVLRVTCDGRSVLLPGDAEAYAQAALIREPNAVRADVLVMPHHGGWDSTLPAFVDAVAPRVVLVSNWRVPTASQSAPAAAREFYAQLPRRYRLYSTAANGWIRVRFGADGVDVRTWR